MIRNKRTEKDKSLRRLSKKTDALWGRARELEWIPVEEPQFLGWDILVVLGDSGLRRSDAPNLLKVMEYFNMGKPVFTRHEWVSKIIRGNNGRYVETLKQAFKLTHKKHSHWSYIEPFEYINRNYMPYFENRRITQQVYDTVPSYLHKYFTRYTERATVWRPEYYYYKLSSTFPRYELRLKSTKSYSTHRGIPDGEAQSEYQKGRDTLNNEHYWGGRGYEAYYHKLTNRSRRKAWNMVVKAVVKTTTIEEAEEALEEQEYYAIGRLARD